MLKAQDVVILLKVCLEHESWTIRSLGDSVGLDEATIHRGLKRLDQAHLYDYKRRKANLDNVEEFLVHSVKYLFPVEHEGEARGVPTAWAADPLVDELAPQDDPPPVWPHPMGSVRGFGIKPLHDVVPEAVLKDPKLGEQLAMIDAIRMGNARVRKLAEKRLSESISQVGSL